MQKSDPWCIHNGALWYGLNVEKKITVNSSAFVKRILNFQILVEHLEKVTFIN